MELIPTLTTAGLSAVFNLTNDGLSAKITHIALGEGAFTPTQATAQLQNERNRVPIIDGRRVNATHINVSGVEDSDLEYWVREIGFYLEDGTLLAVWSDPDFALAFKSAGVDLLLSFDLVLTALPDDSITIVVSGSGFTVNDATESTAGIMRFATAAQTLAGQINDAATTPFGVRQSGDLRYARLVHTHNDLYASVQHEHDETYQRLDSFRVTQGTVRTFNRFSDIGFQGQTDFERNTADIFPPDGFSMQHLMGFMPSIGAVFFEGNVGDDDILYCLWQQRADRIRVICANSENRADALGAGSYVNYLALWSR